jgi:flavodoxin
MKSMVVYSTKTGNTKMVAEAIYDALPEPKDLFNVDENPDPAPYDLVVAGYWVDKGSADAKARDFFRKLNNKQVALFGTLGAYPDSDHANKCREKTRALLYQNEVLGDFICQGKVDPQLIKMMETKMKDDPHHSMTPERKERLAEAAKHPDKQDLENAMAFIREIAEKYSEA